MPEIKEINANKFLDIEKREGLLAAWHALGKELNSIMPFDGDLTPDGIAHERYFTEVFYALVDRNTQKPTGMSGRIHGYGQTPNEARTNLFHNVLEPSKHLPVYVTVGSDEEVCLMIARPGIPDTFFRVLPRSSGPR